MADVARGEFRSQSRVTFAEYARVWVETYTGRTSRGIRPETVREYRAELERRAIPYFGERRLSEIEPRDVKAYIAALAAGLELPGRPHLRRPLSVGSLRQAIAPVRAMLATAVEEGLLRSNPAAGVRLVVPKQAGEDEDEPERAKALSEDQLLLLLKAVPDGWRPFVEFVAHTGLRISEAVALRWSDVDLGAGRLTVRRRFLQVDSLRRRAPTVAAACRFRKACSRRSGISATWSSTLATTRSCGPALLDPDAANLLDRVLKPAARSAGVPSAGWHTLRHTCGTLLFRHGANAVQVQRWLGHHSPAFTLAVYVHLLPDDAPDPDFLDGLTDGRPASARSEAATAQGVTKVSHRATVSRRIGRRSPGSKSAN